MQYKVEVKVEVKVVSKEIPEMVYIPPGAFNMGSNDYYREEPPHEVYLDGYWIGKTTVTVEQYMNFVYDTKTHYPEWLENGSKCNIKIGSDNRYRRLGSALTDDHYPIVGISWHDARAYCEWLSKNTGLNFNLPTEAQWEKAARGTDGRKYPWGNDEPDKNLANYRNTVGKTSPVGSSPKGASPYGLLDMAGNVWEWCNDWYDSNYYNNSPYKNPRGPDSGLDRVVRGGSWVLDVGSLRCTDHYYDNPASRYDFFGFRLCMIN